MKVAFFFDTVLLKDENNDFWGMTLTYDFFKERYLTMFDEMIVSTRVKQKENEKGNIEGYRKTNGNKLDVKPIKNYKEIPDSIKKHKLIKKEVDDIVKNVDKVIIRMPSIIGMFACNSAEKYGKSYLIEMVACPWDGYLNHARMGGKILAPMITFLTKYFVKKAPNVLYVTNEFLQKRYPTKGRQIACSDVVLNQLNNEVLKNRINKIDEKQTIKLCTIASVQLKYKGQKYVIEAISKLKKRGKKFEYYLAGGGDNTRLKKIVQHYKVENEVHFLGSLPHEQVFKLLDSIDFYIQPSLQEGLPRALIEAMSRACPASGSNVGGIPEILNKQCLFKKKKVNQIINILSNINKEKLIELSNENFEKVKKFDKNILETKRQEFYTSF